MPSTKITFQGIISTLRVVWTLELEMRNLVPYQVVTLVFVVTCATNSDSGSSGGGTDSSIGDKCQW